MGVHTQYVSDPARFSGWLDTLIKTAVSQGIQQGIPAVTRIISGGGGSSGGAIKGRAASADFVTQVLAALDGIAAKVKSLSPNDIVANSQQITDTALSLYHSFKNPAIIQWNGSYLQAGYDEAQRKTYAIQQRIQAAYDTLSGSALTITDSNGNMIATTAPDYTPLLIYSAIGIMAIMLLTTD